jgi:hypothetical protein
MVDKTKASSNTMCPGAYAFVTKVDLKALDQYIIKPVGVYGSKTNCTFAAANVVDEDICVFLVLEIFLANHALRARLLLVSMVIPGRLYRPFCM